jgi:predicted nucleotidyltransferase
MKNMFEQDRVLVRLRQRIAREQQIRVCFLTGSYGRGTQDKFSDLDLVLVYKDERSRNLAYEQRLDFARSVLPFLPVRSYDAEHIRPYLHSALYGNGTKVDYQYAAMINMNPTEHFRNVLLIKDTDQDWGRELQISSEQLSPSLEKTSISTQELTELDDVFWVLFMEVYRQVLRGDQISPFTTFLHLLYSTLPKILALLPINDPSQRSLARSLYDDDSVITLDFLRQFLKNYLEARSKIVRRFNLDFQLDSPFERELKKIVANH